MVDEIIHDQDVEGGRRREEKNRADAKHNSNLEKLEQQNSARKTTLLLWLIWLGASLIFGGLATVLYIYLSAQAHYAFILFLLTPIIINAITIAYGWSEVEQNKEWVIELFGKWFTTWEPGLHIKFPFFMFVKSKVPLYTQTITLYMDGTERNGVMEAQINFKDTTSAVVAQIFFRIFSSHRAVFQIDNLLRGIREKIDSGMRAYYGKVELDSAIAEESEDATDENDKQKTDRTDDVIKQKNTEASIFKCWGVEIESIAITDITIPPGIREQRDKIIIANKDKEASLIAVETTKNKATAEKEAAEIGIETARKKAEAARITQEIEGQAIGQEIKKVIDITGLDAKQASQYLLNKAYFKAIESNKGVVIASRDTSAPLMGAEFAAGLGLTNESIKP